MKLMVLVFVSDVERSLAFYEALGFKLAARHRRGGWAELSYGDALLALHNDSHLPNADKLRVSLCFEAAEPLEALSSRLEQEGVPPLGDITDEAFGRTLQFMDPDGLVIQINEHDKELYVQGRRP